MGELSFVPLDRIAVVPAEVERVVPLLRDFELLTGTVALVLVRDEPWRDRPLYYVFGPEDFRSLDRATRDDLAGLTRERLFELLDVHEHTAAVEVESRTDSPGRRAVVLAPDGSLLGAWSDDQADPHPPMSAPPPVMRNGGGTPAPAPPAPPPPAPAPPPAAAPPPSFSVPGPAPEEALPGVGEPAVDSFFRRTPHLDVLAAEPLALGLEFGAAVYLDTEAARPGETVEEVVIDLPDDLDVLEIDVMLAGTPHFAVRGESIKTLTAHRDEPRSSAVEFDLEVVAPTPETPSTPALTAYLTYRHRPCGRVHRPVELQVAARPPGPVPPVEAAPPAELAIDARAQPADLTVNVVRTPENDGRHFLVTLQTTLVDDFAMSEPEHWNFREDTDALVASMMARFTLKDATPFARQASLNGAGTQLWDTAPQSFRELFWRLVDEGRPLQTIYVASEEPNIPWELMRPHRTVASGEFQERKPLGVDFAIGRWVHPGNRSPKQHDPIEDSYVMAPSYVVRPLKTSAQEAEWVSTRFGGTIVTPADQERLDQLLRERPVGLLHFVAHGKSDPLAPQTLILENEAVFDAYQVRGLPGLGAAFRAKAPLVFLNACEVGRTTPALVGAGGFASEFVSAGARGVVAPLWSVRDSIAHEVAVAFYTAALQDRTRSLADILRDIRAKAYAEGGGEDTYAAYCFYGDPLTALDSPED